MGSTAAFYSMPGAKRLLGMKRNWSVFLNPEPSLDQLKAFAFVGSIAAKARWSEIQKAIRQAAGDDKVAELAIVESDKLFSRDSNVSIVTPAGR